MPSYDTFYFSAEPTQIVGLEKDWIEVALENKTLEIQFISKLGQGTGGIVQKALVRDRSHGFARICAVKTITGSKSSSSKIEAAIKEARFTRQVPHPFIMRVFALEKYDNSIRIYSEYFPVGCLNNFLKRNGPLPLSLIRELLWDILRALNIVHTAGIAHLDIKPDNIFLSQAGRPILSDFGEAVKIDSKVGVTVSRGSPSYMAPEVVRVSRPYGRQADIWSLGALTVALLTGEAPFKGLSANRVMVMLGSEKKRPPLPQHIQEKLSPELSCFLDKCFNPDPEKRANVRELLADEFFSSITKNIPLKCLNSPKFCLQSDSQNGNLSVIDSDRTFININHSSQSVIISNATNEPPVEKMTTMNNTNNKIKNGIVKMTHGHFNGDDFQEEPDDDDTLFGYTVTQVPVRHIDAAFPAQFKNNNIELLPQLFAFDSSQSLNTRHNQANEMRNTPNHFHVPIEAPGLFECGLTEAT